MIIYYTIMNLLGLLLMGVDKYKAVHHQYRIKESVLFYIIYCGGMLGSAMGMFLFHHKIRKKKFIVSVILAFILHISFFIF